MTTLMEDVELRAAIAEACRGDEKARELVIEAHLPLVRSLAARYRGRGESVDDLAQVGAIGLVLALQRFDPSRGVPFRSFAIPTIVGEIRRHFRDRSWAMHVPRRLKELSLRLTRTVEDLTAQLGRPPTIAELAAELEIGEDDVLEAMDVANAYSTRSLSEQQFDDRDDDSYRAALAQTDDGFTEVEDVAFIEQGFEALDGRLRTIVQLRFFDGRTQSEIASQLGISQMHVSRLLRQALELMHGRLVEAEEGDRS
jgi:RNA polymerase sigma-B factor